MGKRLDFAHFQPRLIVIALVVALSSVAASPLAAHELGSQELRLTIRDSGDYVLEIAVDPENLLQRLELLSGEELSEPASAAGYRERIDAKKELFLSRVDLRFDGRRVTPEYSYSIESQDLTALSALITLRGTIPTGARQATLSYGLVFSNWLFTVRHERGKEASRQWVSGDQTSAPVPIASLVEPLSRLEVARQYLILGFTHILPKGLDHILFVLGLFLLAPRWRPVLAQVTAFTVAHSITLALTIYDVVSLPGNIVEPLIALSIVYVAFENCLTRTIRPWRVALVFLFGLLHGMGFAGVLSELGIPRSEFVTALVTFNIGVEIGQLAVIAIAWIVLVKWTAGRPWYRRRILIPLSLLIAAMGAFWLIERTLGNPFAA
jgi:hypothetical protein